MLKHVRIFFLHLLNRINTKNINLIIYLKILTDKMKFAILYQIMLQMRIKKNLYKFYLKIV